MAPSRNETVWACGLLLVVMSLGQSLSKAPLLRIIELNLCRVYYQRKQQEGGGGGYLLGSDADGTEGKCKAHSIQKDLATINAYNAAINSVVEIVTAFPYASLAARFSRRRILAANVAGTVNSWLFVLCICYYQQTFDIRLVVGQSIWRLFGGGDCVLSSVAKALMAENLPEANLSKFLFVLNAMRLMVNAVGQTAGAHLMRESVWIPPMAGLAVYCLTVPTLWWIADARDEPKEAGRMTEGSSETEPLLAVRPEVGTREGRNDGAWLCTGGTVWRIIIEGVREPTTAVALAVVFLNELGHGVNNIVQQWSSSSFGWTLGDANYLTAGQRVVAALTLLGLSWSSHWLQRVGVAGARLDVGLLHACQWLALAGMLAAAMSCLSGSEGRRAAIFIGGLFVYMMGWGMVGVLQACMARSIARADLTMLYTRLGVADQMAGTVSGPIFAKLLTLGMQKGGRWNYVPFWVSVGLFAVVCGLTMSIAHRLGGPS